jgi:hypothetical protein
MSISLPDYEGKKAAAALFGWELSGWAVQPKVDDTVSLCRWEDKNDCPIAPPPTILRADGRTFYDTADGQHQVFIRLPFFDAPEVWLLLLRADALRRFIARKGS